MRGESGIVCHRGFLSVPKILPTRGKIKRPVEKTGDWKRLGEREGEREKENHGTERRDWEDASLR